MIKHFTETCADGSGFAILRNGPDWSTGTSLGSTCDADMRCQPSSKCTLGPGPSKSLDPTAGRLDQLVLVGQILIGSKHASASLLVTTSKALVTRSKSSARTYMTLQPASPPGSILGGVRRASKSSSQSSSSQSLPTAVLEISHMYIYI